MRYRHVALAFSVCLAFISCRQSAEVETEPHLGRGVSVDAIVRQAPVTDHVDGADHVLACLVWANRVRERLSTTQDSARAPSRASLSTLTKSADEPAILVVMRGYRQGGSFGNRYGAVYRQGSVVLKRRLALTRGDDIWATYEVSAEPFTESFLLAGKSLSLDAGRIILADFADEPVRVQQVNVDCAELAEVRDALADDSVPITLVQRQLRSTLQQLARRNATVRKFVGNALSVASTH